MARDGADGGRRGARTILSAVILFGLASASLLAQSGGPSELMMAQMAGPQVIYTPASKPRDYSIRIPSTWKPGTKLGVKV